MKRLLTVLLIGLMLVGGALAVNADPINVGGGYSLLFARTPGPGIQPFEMTCLCSPINVGGG